MDSPIARSSSVTPYLIFLVLITTLGPLQFGYHLAELNAPEEALRCKKRPSLGFTGEWHVNHGLPECLPMENAQFALVSSIFTVGGLIGALSAGPISSRRGRRLPLRLTAPFFFVGSIMGAAAPNVATMATGRFLAGIGAGASIVVGPVYISEISPPSLKGTLGAFTQIMINVGILLAQILGYFLSHDGVWRGILGAAAVISALHFLGMFGLVESFEWLGSNGDISTAKAVLNRIRGGHLSPEESLKWGDHEASDEQESLLTPQSSLNSRDPKAKQPLGILATVFHPDHWRAIVAVIAVMMAQQFTGINSVMMYSVLFLKDLLPTGAALITVAVGALNVIVTAACAPLADKLGRKFVLLMSIAGMGISSTLLAFGIAHDQQVLSGVATLLFVAAFATGLGPVPFILASELVGPEAVGSTQSLALGANFSSTFVVAQFFPMLRAAMGKGQVFFIFAALALLFFCFILWWVPESKGKANADEVWGRERRED